MGGINRPDLQDKTLIINNMKAHYGSIIKAGISSIGSDEMSKSIFSQIDKNQNGMLNEKEVSGCESTLSSIINNVAENFYEMASKFFGKTYTQQLDKANEKNQTQNPEGADQAAGEWKSPTQKVIQENLDEGFAKIAQYAQEHPEDERIQSYMKKIEEIKQGSEITDETTYYTAATITGDKKIIYDGTEVDNLDPDTMIRTIIHEAGHYINGDELSSITEEVDVETYALDTTEKITGKPVVENKEEYLQEFAEMYENSMGANYGKSSPGYDGIPLNAGFVINDEITSVAKGGNSTSIYSDFAGWRQEHTVTMGEEKDENGNPYPTEASRTLYQDNGEAILWKFSDYNKDKKIWQKEEQAESDDTKGN